MRRGDDYKRELHVIPQFAKSTRRKEPSAKELTPAVDATAPTKADKVRFRDWFGFWPTDKEARQAKSFGDVGCAVGQSLLASKLAHVQYHATAAILEPPDYLTEYMRESQKRAEQMAQLQIELYEIECKQREQAQTAVDAAKAQGARAFNELWDDPFAF